MNPLGKHIVATCYIGKSSLKFGLLLLSVNLNVLAGCNIKETNSQFKLAIIPYPVRSVLLKDSFVLTNKTRILIDEDPGTQTSADWLQTFLQASTGYKNPLSNTKENLPAIRLSLNKQFDAGIGDEGYDLLVESNGVLIKANKPNGLFYGIQTFIQLLPGRNSGEKDQGQPQWKIPGVKITDYPRFKWRGLMLDVSRHFFSVNEIKRLVDEMAGYKFNILHLHLTDDNGWRIEIKSLPELTRVGAWRVPRSGWWGVRPSPGKDEVASYGGFYTQEEIKDLVAYARSRAVDILPEIDVPGHSLAAIASYKNLSCTKLAYKVNPGSNFYGIDDNALCAGNDSTYAFMEKVFTEVAALFPYPYIHVGGDECYKGFWETCPQCKQRIQTEHLKNKEELQGYFFRRVEKILTAKGKKMIGWDEILEGRPDTDATIMNWLGTEGVLKAAKQRHNVITSPREYAYLDLYQGDPAAEKPSFGMLRLKKVYEFEPVPAEADSRFIIGGQGNLWTEFVPEFNHAEYMLWPRAFALSEVFWSVKQKRNWENFVWRTEQHLQRFKKSGINYSSGFYDVIIDVSKNKKGMIMVRMDTELDSLQIYYTINGTEPGIYSLEYKKGETISFPGSATVLKVTTCKNGQQAGKTIVLPLYELERRSTEKQ